TLSVERLPELLQAVGQNDAEPFKGEEKQGVAVLLEQLEQAERPILIGGADLLGGDGVDALCAAAQQRSSDQRQVGVITLLAGPNSLGGGLLADDGPLFDTLLDAIQESSVKALVCLASDPFSEAINPSRAQSALGHLELLISIDATPSLAAQRADIFLPARANAEMAGSYVNNEGRLQAFLPVIDPGTPIRVTGQGGHPPREFFREAPGSTPEPDWRLLARLLDRETELAAVRKSIATTDARFAPLATIAAETEGERLQLSGPLPPAAEQGLQHAATDALTLLAIPDRIGSHWLAHLSAPLAATAAQPYIILHPALAARLGLAEGDRARLTTHFGHCTVVVHVEPGMVEDQVLAPQLWDTALEGMVPGSRCECRLDKEVKA
ncbi:MAG: molybdopterin dinucleotide binding domain-containing protein, partial [Desulfuromonadales bacterium]